MSDEDSDDDIFCGPLTIQELKKQSKLYRQKRDDGNLHGGQENPIKSEAEIKPFFSFQPETEVETLEAPPPSPSEKHDVFHEETEQVVIQEFSLDEACFSGCNLSGLNLSFESGVSDPLAVDPLLSNHYGGGGEEMSVMPTDLIPKDIVEVPTGLYTLACISDLAEKLCISETEATPDEATNDMLATPAQSKGDHSISHLYSPISPADLSSQYLDAIDESLMNKNQDISKLPSGLVIDAIVSLQNKMQQNILNPETNYSLGHINKNDFEDSPEKNIQVLTECQLVECPSVEVLAREESFLQDDSLCNEEQIRDISLSLVSSDASPQKAADLSCQSSQMNDTIDEMDMILSMGVDYLETLTHSTSRIEPQASASKQKYTVKENAVIPLVEKSTGSTRKFFCTPKMKNSQPFIESQESERGLQRRDGYGSEDNLKSSVFHITSSKSSPSLDRRYIAPPTNKYFQSPAMFKTPVNAKTSSEAKSASTGASAKTDAASKVHVSTPFRVPKATEPRSADFKQPASRLPKLSRAVNMTHITSPVSQYIRGPVVAPRFTVVRPRSPLCAQRQPTKFPESKLFSSPHVENKAEIENSNPNIPALNLPYVNYDTASSIKVVEHMENKHKPLPNKIKKLMPSPGAVLRHTGRVNIPEYMDGRHEVSIMVSHDAIH